MKKEESSLPNRRDFIRLGSGALVVASFGAAGPLQAAAAKTAPICSLGYWPGVPKATGRFRSDAQPYLVPAESILAGDPAFFSTAARASVRGIWLPEAARTHPASFALDVMYDVDGQKAPFYAWSYAVASLDAPKLRSQNLAFDIPVGPQGTMDLAVFRAGERQTLRFSVNSAADTLKLRPGFYFLAFAEGVSPETIDWTRIRMRGGFLPTRLDANGPGVLTTTSLLGGEEPVPFSYLVLKVDVSPAR